MDILDQSAARYIVAGCVLSCGQGHSEQGIPAYQVLGPACGPLTAQLGNSSLIAKLGIGYILRVLEPHSPGSAIEGMSDRMVAITQYPFRGLEQAR